MRIKILKFISCVMLSLPLYGNEGTDFHSMATLSGPSDAMIDGCVNAITGDLRIPLTVTVRGAEPIQLHITYVSRSAKSNNGGWSLFPSLYAFDEVNEKGRTISLRSNKGIPLIYKGELSEGQYKYFLSNKAFKVGYTNCGTGEVSGRNNLALSYIERSVYSQTGNPRKLVLYLPDGTMRTYKPDPLQKNLCRLEKDRLPNGHIVMYTYHGLSNRPKSIVAYNNATESIEYARLDITWHGKLMEPTGFDVATSDGQRITFSLSKKRKGIDKYEFITSCTGSRDIPKVFHYRDQKTKNGCLIQSISFPEDRSKAFTFIEKHHEVKGMFHGRVASIASTLESNASEHLYHIEYPYAGDPEKHSGHTIVTDAYGNRTVYGFNKFLRLERVEYYERQALSHASIFEWDGYNLVSKGTKDALGNTIYLEKIAYDANENPRKLIRCGNLTGKGYGTYEIQRIFSEDGKNLLLEEREQNGLLTRYQYKSGTNLLKSKFIYDSERIILRNFYEYDSNNILVQQYVDDGSTTESSNLQGVTQRRITAMQLKTTRPFAGMPEIIEERYVDLASGQERLIKRVELAYDNQGNVVEERVFDATRTHRYTIQRKYGANGLLEWETNPLGHKISYNYDGNHNLITEKSLIKQVATSHAYDYGNRRKRSRKYAKGIPEQITTCVHDKRHNVVAMRDYLGHETRYAYDVCNRPCQIEHPPICSSNLDMLIPRTHMTYDPCGNQTSHIDENGNKTRTTYTAYNKPLLVTHADGSAEKYTYYADGKLHTYEDQEGVITTYTYDVLGREETKTVSKSGRTFATEVTTYNSFHLLTRTDAEGNATSYTYDQAGKKIAEEILNSEGSIVETTEYTYDPLGRIYCIKRGDTCAYKTYDVLDRVVQEWSANQEGTIFAQVGYAYDDAGNTKTITRYIQGKEAKEILSYDSFDRIISQVDALGRETTYQYDEDHSQKMASATTISPLGVETTTIYNAHGHPHILTIKDPQGNTISKEELYYDPAGNATLVTSTIYRGTEQYTTSRLAREYDSLHRLTALVEAADTPCQKTISYTYYPAGRLETVTKADGVVLTHTYDPLGNPQTLIASDGSISYAFTHNKLGYLEASVDRISGQRTTRRLDYRGRVLQETLGNGLALSSFYDDQGRRQVLIYPDDSRVLYSYQGPYLASITKQDAYGTIRYTHQYNQYDLSGNLLSEISIFSQEPIIHTYELSGQRRSIQSPYFTQSVTKRDAHGNITALATNKARSSYTYDYLDQLTSESGIFTHTYSYDSHHNRHAIDSDLYTINQLNQVEATATSEITYDLNGNPTLQGETTYEYDALDRLIQVATPNTIYLYGYDSFHRRISETILTRGFFSSQFTESDQRLFFYDGQNELGSATASGEIKELRVLGATPHAEMGASIALELSGETYAPVHDLFGNLTAIVNASNTIYEQYSFSAFGEEKASSTLNPWRFSSKRADETSLIYFGRRYYSTALGRWLTPDPNSFTDGYNLYAYVHNAPLTHIDLYGLNDISFQESTIDITGVMQPPTWNETRKTFADIWNVSITQAAAIGRLSSWQVLAVDGLCQRLSQTFNKHGYSRIIEVGSVELPGVAIVVENGINNSTEDAVRTAMQVSEYAGGAKVYLVYNASHSVVVDLLECVTMRLGVRMPPSELTRGLWNTLIDTHGPDLKILQLNHSNGSAHTKHALLDSPASVRNQITSLAIAPAQIIPHTLCSQSYNYASKRDFVTHLDVFGMLLHEDELYVLKPHRDAHFVDHEVLSPTFAKPLRDHIVEHVNYNR